jgi:hypothetical protein
MAEPSRECSDHRESISLAQTILRETSVRDIANDQHTGATELHATHRTLALKPCSITANSLDLSKKPIRQTPGSRKLFTTKLWE